MGDNISLNKCKEEFFTPADEFTPVPFWFLNDRLTYEEMRTQLRDFRSKGVDAVVLHPRIGLPDELEYMSEEFIDYIRFATQTACELGMRVVLYDEGMYPSGSACGQVVASNPEFAAHGIIKRAPTGAKVIAECAHGEVIEYDCTGGTIRGIHWDEDDGCSNAPAAADLLCREAVGKFIELTHERYYSALAGFFGNTVIGIFTDEPSLTGRRAKRGMLPWTRGFEEDFIHHGGSMSELEQLFSDADNSQKDAYRAAVEERVHRVYYSSLHDWCEAHGVMLMGHPDASDDIGSMKYFHIPGQDIVWRSVAPEKHNSVSGTDSVQAKVTADSARHRGLRRNSNECFGACCLPPDSQNFTFDDMKWYLDWLFVRGVNLILPHAFYYSLRGERLNERPPDVGPHSAWWDNYGQVSQYIKRMCWLMTDSRNAAEVAVMSKNTAPWQGLDYLYENQIEFNYVEEALCAEAQDGTLTAGDYRYSCVFGRDDIIKSDIFTTEPQPFMRASHIIKHGVDFYLFTNEGEEDISTCVELCCKGKDARVQLWDAWEGTISDSPLLHTERNAVKIPLTLARRKSIIAVCS